MGRIGLPRPLAADDDRTGFDCGRAALNSWLVRHAWRNQSSDVSRTTVLAERETGRIVAFVSLAAGQIARAHLAKQHQRNKPDPLPVLLLGQLAVDVRDQGAGHGRSLLLHAIRTARGMADVVGCFGVATHPIDDTARALYARWGFVELPFDPAGSTILRMVDIRANEVRS